MGDADPTELFQSGELIGELKRKLAERILDAEMDEHLSLSAVQDQDNVRCRGTSPMVVIKKVTGVF